MTNKMMHLLLSILVVSLVGLVIPSAFAENVPDWVKNNAGWWATDQIDDSSFIQGIQYLIKEGIMVIPPSETSESTGSQVLPSWIKNNAGWWADGLIDDSSFVLGMQWLISNGIIIVEDKLISTDANFRVAFIADQGIKPSSIAVLNLIKDEGAHMVLHQGDLYYEVDYRDIIDPDAWDRMISNVLGDDFPYFITVGGHDLNAWNEFQQMAYDRLKKNPDAKCTGDLGVKSFCTYKGLFFIQVSPSLKFYESLDHSSFIENQLNGNDHLWRVCSWQGNMHDMQIGSKKDSTGWEVYENCKNYGAIIATATEHSYHRTKTMIDIENQIVDAEWSKPDKLRVEEGSTFVFVSGLGGWSIRDQDRCLPTSYPYGCNGEWANIYTSDQDANFGALFCTFNVGGQPNKAYCYFKNIDGRIVDAFTITNFLGIHTDNTNLLNFDKSGTNLTGDDLSNSVIIDANLSNTMLVDADLSNSVLIGTTFRGADLTGANLAGIISNGKDLTGSILRGADLTGANIAGIDLSGMDLTGTILRGADLTGANLAGIDLSGMDLTGTILRGVDLTNKDLTSTVLSGADLTGANLTGIDLSGIDLSGIDLSGIDLSGIDLSGIDLSGATLRGVDLTNKDLTSTVLSGADLTGANLAGIDLSGMNLTGTILRGVDLSNSILTGVDLSGKDLTRTKLVGVDLSDHDLTETILRGADLTGAVLPSGYLSGNNFKGTIGHMTIFDEVNLSGKDLSESDFEYASFKNTNLKNANLRYAIFLATDLTDANLTGADLLGTSFAFANLSGVNLSGAILEQTNFYNADLTGRDFTGVFNNFIDGGLFPNADLSNSNFEGVILSPQEFFTTAFKNKASAINLEDESFLDKLFCGKDEKCSGYPNIHVISKKVRGNDLVVDYLFYNNFKNANLENANFKNADLVFANFLNANLTNADLSGADLRKSLLEGANLDGANLDGANLEGANLKCLNHPICLND